MNIGIEVGGLRLKATMEHLPVLLQTLLDSGLDRIVVSKECEGEPKTDTLPEHTCQKLFTVKELARLINYSTVTINNWIKHGGMNAKKENGRYIIDISDVDRFMKATNRSRPYYD